MELPNAREAAVEDALRRCVEVGGGVDLVGMSESRDFALVADVIYTKTAGGYVKQYNVLQENPDQNGLYTVRVEAVVARADINEDAMAFRALLERKGRPRLLVVGSADGELFDSRITAQFERDLNRKGIHVVASDRLKVNQQRDAQRAAIADNDLRAAAMIAEETGADYLVVVDVQGEQHPPQEVYGSRLYPVDAVGIVRVIAADTAQLVERQRWLGSRQHFRQCRRHTRRALRR